MLLAIDIGNTNICLCFHDGEKWGETLRVRTKDFDNVRRVEELLSSKTADMSVISSVVPNLTDKIFTIVRKISRTEPVIVSTKIKTGLSDIPVEIGSDILCNLIAAHCFYPDQYVTVADFGTAFTTETVSPEGKVLGVTIAPGMMTSVKALFENTAQLPEIALDLPDTVLGRDTVSSIRAGVLYGFSGQLTALIDRIELEIGQKPFVVATGGFSRYIKPYVDRVGRCDVAFTLEGARLACLMNQ